MKSQRNKFRNLETEVTYNISIKLYKQLGGGNPVYYLSPVVGKILEKVKNEITQK